MPDVVVFGSAGPDDAPVLALLWAQAEARRSGSVPRDVDSAAIQGVRERFDQAGAVALVATQDGRPVPGCFATQALVDGEPVAGRAHVSCIAVAPDRWGEGLAHTVLQRLNDLLLEHGYDTAQLYVLETNFRARSVYEHIGWRLIRTGEPHPEGPHAVYETSLGERS